MNLLEIKNPRFLKKMSVKELESLSSEIRSFIIEKIDDEKHYGLSYSNQFDIDSFNKSVLLINSKTI